MAMIIELQNLNAPEMDVFAASLLRDVVEDFDVENEHTQIGLSEARRLRPGCHVGDRIPVKLETKEFGRIAAQNAKHVIRQSIREAERNRQCSEMQSKAHEIVTATVVAVDPDRGIVNLNTNVPGLHCLGDSSGWTRGLMMASAMGVLMGRKLAGML